MEALRGSGGDEQTGHLIYNKAHCNLLLTTSYYPSGWCAYNSGLALTFLSKKLNALWIREDIFFVKLFVFSAANWSYWGITFFLFQSFQGDKLILGFKQHPSINWVGLPWWLSSKESACNAVDAGSIPGAWRLPGEGNATHSSIPAWQIPWREETGRLQSMGLQQSRTSYRINNNNKVTEYLEYLLYSRQGHRNHK